jgi:hypothetical protein
MQLTDTLQEQNGLLTDGREPGISPDQIRAINRRTATSVPAEEISQFQHGDYPNPLDERIAQRPAVGEGTGRTTVERPVRGDAGR